MVITWSLCQSMYGSVIHDVRSFTVHMNYGMPKLVIQFIRISLYIVCTTAVCCVSYLICLWLTSEWILLWGFCSHNIWGYILYCNYLNVLYLQLLNTSSQNISVRYPLYGGILYAYICGGAADNAW